MSDSTASTPSLKEELEALRARLEAGRPPDVAEFVALGARLIAISPPLPEHRRELIEPRDLTCAISRPAATG